MIFNINLLSRLILDSFLVPVDALVYIHHLGIWLVSWSPVPRWAVTEGMKKTDTSISQWSCQNREGICKGRENERAFFSPPPHWVVSFFVFLYLIRFTVLQPYWACAKENEPAREFVPFCCYKWIWELCVCLCLLNQASVCIFREGIQSLRDMSPATTYWEDYPQIQCSSRKPRDFLLPA